MGDEQVESLGNNVAADECLDVKDQVKDLED